MNRGQNRFPALIRTLELLAGHPEAIERGYQLPDLGPLCQWIATAQALSGKALQTYVDNHPDASPVLLQAARWSAEVDHNIARIVRHVPPFPNVRQALDKLRQFSDIVVVSATPHEAIVREWDEHGLLEYVNVVAGQELGSKADCIRAAAGDHYLADRVLMIGDAPGDFAAAQANLALFCPIVPEHENASWQSIQNEVADLFFTGRYAGELENDLLAKIGRAHV